MQSSIAAAATNTKTNLPSITLWGLFLLLFLILTASKSLSPVWSDNEVHYFDLAFRMVNPEAFTTQHSALDNSKARFASFAIIGGLIDLVGFEAAKRILTVVLWFGLSAALATLSVALRLSLVETALALAVFLTARQALVGGEWIFGNVEAKIFAYVSVIFGLALAFWGRWLTAVIFMAAATYFHFLVGGFWALSIIFLRLLQTRRPGKPLVMLGGYVVLILPITVVLVSEYLGGDVDMTGLDLTLPEIYAVYRNPHHVAPFANIFVFRRFWAPGIINHFGFVVAFVLLSRMNGHVPRQLAVWLALLNGYIILVTIIAFIDRNTHVLGPLYMFRPASLIFLLSVLYLGFFVRMAVDKVREKSITVVGLILVMAFAAPPAALSVGLFVFRTVTLENQIRPPERALVDWIRENTPETSSILLEAPEGVPSLAEGNPNGYGAMERLTARGFIVNFKFVPSGKAEMARWYRLLQARSALFEGDCSQLNILNADFIVAFQSTSVELVKACGSLVHQLDGYAIFDARVNS